MLQFLVLLLRLRGQNLPYDVVYAIMVEVCADWFWGLGVVYNKIDREYYVEDLISMLVLWAEWMATRNFEISAIFSLVINL